METLYLVAYDISDRRRLAKIARIMEGYGIRVQKSVFETSLSTSSLNELKLRILQTLDPVEDGVKFFRICEKCYQNSLFIGEDVDYDFAKSHLII